MFAGGDADGPRRPFAQFAEGGEVGVDIVEARGRRASSRSPASVGATLRVVRASRRSPSRASRARSVWLSADCETPSLRGRPGETTFARHGDEGEDVMEIVSGHS